MPDSSMNHPPSGCLICASPSLVTCTLSLEQHDPFQMTGDAAGQRSRHTRKKRFRGLTCVYSLCPRAMLLFAKQNEGMNARKT